MENEISVEGFGVSSSVVETIVTLSIAEVDGVAGIGPADTFSGLRSVLAGEKNTSTGVEARMVDNDKIALSIRIQVYYGYKIVEVAAAVREVVADAVLSQLGAEVAAVDIFVDGVVFIDPE